jgi:sugar phosphate isomerase/epimerase
MARPKVGLQLYTVREDCAKDFPGTARKVADLGYEGVELAGEGDLSAQELKALMADCGLEIAGSHSPFETLRNELDRVIEFNRAVGNKRIVCPYLPDFIQEKGRQGYQEAACALYGVAQKLKEAGMSLSYHNHSFEFVPDGDAYLLDTLLEQTAPAGVLAELDTYWVKHGGADPVDYIEKYSGRIEILHIKDMAAGEERAFAEIGSGILDWDGIFAAAEKAGVLWYIVEQDICPGPPLESAKKSLDYLKSRGMLS